MKSFSERNPVILGVVGAGLTALIVLIALQFNNVPFVHPVKQYSAYFAEAGGLSTSSSVQVSGSEVGQVTGVSLEGTQVLVTFRVHKDIPLGDRTEAAIKTKSLLGTKYLEVSPRGTGSLTGPIPAERTIPPYNLADAVGDLSTTVKGLDTDQLSQSLSTLAETFSKTPPEVQGAVQGLSRFSLSLNKRDEQLRSLLANANKATKVLGDRTDQVVSLLHDSNALLAELSAESTALDQISGNLSALSKQLSGFVAENRETLRPAVDKLNGVLTILANRKEELQVSIRRINSFALSLGEAVSSGPFFNALLGNLVPGQFVQPFIDAAFSDLGLDPNTLPPSLLTDPQIGQPATPALPLPMPRTGQGGDPRLTLPDAITGNPGDQQCGPPGVPLPGPGCYPYRDPGPAPVPGGPPPGPPVPAAVDPGVPVSPTPAPVFVPAPGEPPADRGAGS